MHSEGGLNCDGRFMASSWTRKIPVGERRDPSLRKGSGLPFTFCQLTNVESSEARKRAALCLLSGF